MKVSLLPSEYGVNSHSLDLWFPRGMFSVLFKADSAL